METPATTYQLALVPGKSPHVPDFVSDVRANGHHIIAEFNTGKELYPLICKVSVDTVVIIADLIDIAVKAGISPSVVGGLDSPRPKPLLQAAISRFRENQRVLKKSPKTETALEIFYRAPRQRCCSLTVLS